MKRIFILGVLICLFATSVLAVSDPDPDGIGFYADVNGDINSITIAPMVPFNVYLLATNISAAGGLAGWEMALGTTGPVSYLGSTIPYLNVNVGIYPDFIVGCGADIRPWAPAILLMELQLLVTDPAVAELLVRNSSAPPGGSLGNFLPVYANGADFNDLRNLFPSSGRIDLPVMRINGEAPIAAEGYSWGSVKSLYKD